MSFLFTLSILLQVSNIKEMKYNDLRKVIRSNDIVIVDVWATWCIPCKKSFPTFAKFSRAHKEVKCIAVSVNHMEDIDKAEAFVAKQDFNGISVILNEDADTIENNFKSKDPDTGQIGFFIPLTILYKKGKIITYHVGSYEMKDLLEMLDKLEK